jgi:hypothetical protein
MGREILFPTLCFIFSLSIKNKTLNITFLWNLGGTLQGIYEVLRRTSITFHFSLSVYIYILERTRLSVYTESLRHPPQFSLNFYSILTFCYQVCTPYTSPKQSTTMPIQFYTNGMPDITPSTRILSVCAIADFESAASPGIFGPFLSDFFALVHTFKGMGTHQTWMLSKDCRPERLMWRYSRLYKPVYLFGDPAKPRKVVLSPSMIEAKTLPDITTSEVGKLKEDFVRAIERERANLLQKTPSH